MTGHSHTTCFRGQTSHKHVLPCFGMHPQNYSESCPGPFNYLVGSLSSHHYTMSYKRESSDTQTSKMGLVHHFLVAPQIILYIYIIGFGSQLTRCLAKALGGSCN